MTAEAEAMRAACAKIIQDRAAIFREADGTTNNVCYEVLKALAREIETIELPMNDPAAIRAACVFTKYRRSQIAELRPYTPGETVEAVSISAPDKEAGSPKLGDMIARNPKNHDDQWLVAAQYFEPADSPPQEPAAQMWDEGLRTGDLDDDECDVILEHIRQMPTQKKARAVLRQALAHAVQPTQGTGDRDPLEHDFDGDFGPCKRCGRYVEECMEHRYCDHALQSRPAVTEPGWTGKKCPACKGHGERYNKDRDCDAACPDCGGTGEQYVSEPATATPPGPGDASRWQAIVGCPTDGSEHQMLLLDGSEILGKWSLSQRRWMKASEPYESVLGGKGRIWSALPGEMYPTHFRAAIAVLAARTDAPTGAAIAGALETAADELFEAVSERFNGMTEGKLAVAMSNYWDAKELFGSPASASPTGKEEP